jgi:hypothetical protein
MARSTGRKRFWFQQNREDEQQHQTTETVAQLNHN